MKLSFKFIAVLLSFCLCLSGCSFSKTSSDVSDDTSSQLTTSEASVDNSDDLESQIYSNLIDQLGADYYIEDIQVSYVSKEYLEEVEYNSQNNLYFGYSLEELESSFDGERYVFTVEDGQTVVKTFEGYDDSQEKAMKDVATGTGVILVCVSVAAVSATAAPAVSVIFTCAAEGAAIGAASSAVIGGCISGVVAYSETKDLNETLKAAGTQAANDFKWGAIVGAATGGIAKFADIKKAAEGGLTLNQAAALQKDSKWSTTIIGRMSSVEESQVYKTGGLKEATIGGNKALVRDIDLSMKSTLEDGTVLTNEERIRKGLSPLDSNGVAYELHHIGQNVDSPLAILTKSEHQGNSSVLHTKTENGVHSLLSESEWAAQRNKFWLDYLEYALAA
jgi:hypothetical protein